MTSTPPGETTNQLISVSTSLPTLYRLKTRLQWLKLDSLGYESPPHEFSNDKNGIQGAPYASSACPSLHVSLIHRHASHDKAWS